jgi:hypothetical protein
MAIDPLPAVAAVVAALDAAGLDYLIGGSLASSVHGVPRSTQDADLVVDLPAAKVGLLVGLLRPRFYVDEERAKAAVARRASFNVLDLETTFKVDIFVLRDEPLARSEMDRRQRVHLGGGPGGDEHSPVLFVATAEDTILQKLRWFRMGDGVSDRQWRDVVSVLEVNRGRLDSVYLERWAAWLGVDDLLREAMAEAEQPPAG